MKKRVMCMLLAVVMMLGMFPGTALAASSEGSSGRGDIYNGGYPLSYLSINGRVRELIYTYYNYVDRNGQVKEIPAYCVNPNTKGVPQRWQRARASSTSPRDRQRSQSCRHRRQRLPNAKPW